MPSRFRLVQDHPIAALLVAVVLALAGLAFGLYPRAESGIDGVQLTLQEGAFGPVVGFTDEGTARDYEQLIRGIVRSPGKGAPPEDLIEFFVAFMQPCAVRLAPGMRVRPVDRTVVERGLWCEVLDGEHAGLEQFTGEDGRYRFEGVAGELDLSVTRDGYHEQRASVNVARDRTLDFRLESLPAGTPFEAGRRLVNDEIAPGRYFADPVSGCFWERLGATGGVLASEFLAFDAGQEIVDIAASDHMFHSDSDCGDWRLAPVASPPAGRIPAGRWLVGEQVEPGEYVTDAGTGCYWARLRRFSGETRLDAIDNEFVAAGGRRSVTVLPTDAGFFSDPACGTWTRSGGVSAFRATETGKTDGELERNRERYRSHRATH